MMSLLMLVFSVSPILAPLAGSAVIGLGGWRGCSGRSAAAVLGMMAMVRACRNPQPSGAATAAWPTFKPMRCCCVTGITWVWCSSGLRHGGLFRLPGGLALCADQPLRPLVHAVQHGVC
jgi:MFS family permease